MMKHFEFILLCAGLISCNHPKDLIGTYHSNTPEMGLLVTTIRLKPDSSFDLIVKGKSIYDSSIGEFRISNHRLFFTKIWEKTGQDKWTRIERDPKTYGSNGDSIEYQAIFYFGDEKLYRGDFETGKKITRVAAYNKRKKYLLFGTHYYKSHWYLKRMRGS
jgi:hypothetical protein